MSIYNYTLIIALIAVLLLLIFLMISRKNLKKVNAMLETSYNVLELR